MPEIRSSSPGGRRAVLSDAPGTGGLEHGPGTAILDDGRSDTITAPERGLLRRASAPFATRNLGGPPGSGPDGSRPDHAGKGPLVICRESRLLDMVSAAAASVGAEVLVRQEAADIRAHWRSSPVVLIGAESAPLVAGLALPERASVFLLSSDADTAAAWSVPLSAAVIQLPQHAGFLPSVLDQSASTAASSTTVLDVMGGSGGVGASIFAAALAQRGAARGGGQAVALVDCDPTGGGIDLLFGAEQQPGWRWHDLAYASGTVGDLTGRLPVFAGVDILSMARTPAAPELPGTSAFRAVLEALARGHDAVVLDDPQGLGWPGSGSVTRIVLVAAEVRAAMAAQARINRHGWHDAAVVVRTGPGMRVVPAVLAQSLGLRLVGCLATDPRFVDAVVSGVPLSRATAPRRFRNLDAVLDEVCPDA